MDGLELRFERGVPTDEELAAIVGVLLSRGTPAPGRREVPTSRWAESGRPAGQRRGPQAWRASALPR